MVSEKHRKARQLRKGMTKAEQILWQHLRNRQFCGVKFKRQFPVGPYIADFLCHESGLIIELDGDQHGHEAQRRHDERRTAFLAAAGYHVVRFWNNQITENCEGVLTEIAHIIKSAHL